MIQVITILRQRLFTFPVTSKLLTEVVSRVVNIASFEENFRLARILAEVPDSVLVIISHCCLGDPVHEFPVAVLVLLHIDIAAVGFLGSSVVFAVLAGVAEVLPLGLLELVLQSRLGGVGGVGGFEWEVLPLAAYVLEEVVGDVVDGGFSVDD